MPQLTEDEIERLRSLLPYADELKEQSEYRQAKSLIWRRWRQFVIALAAFIAAAILLWEQGAKVFKAMFSG